MSIDELEQQVDLGNEVLADHFATKQAVVKKGYSSVTRLKQDIVKTNLDLTKEMLTDLDDMADRLNISRQAVIKMMIQHELDRHFLAKSAKAKFHA